MRSWDQWSGWRRWGAPVRSSWVVLSLFMSISNKNMLQTNTCHYYHIWAPAFTRYNRGQFNEGKIMELHELGRNSKHFNSNNIISLMSKWSHISTCHTVDSCRCGLCPQHSQWQLFLRNTICYNNLHRWWWAWQFYILEAWTDVCQSVRMSEAPSRLQSSLLFPACRGELCSAAALIWILLTRWRH